MEHVLELIRQHGDLFYLITFLWTAAEGETFVLFAGLAAQRGLLNIEMLFLMAALGSLFGDQVFFFVGRKFGKKLVKRFPTLQPKLDKVFGALEKYATFFILSYRFMYGIRNVSALAIGMSDLPWKRFFILNTIASFVWSFIFCGAGYLVGEIVGRVTPGDEEAVNIEVRSLMLAVLGLFALIVVLRFYHVQQANGRKDKADKAQS